MADGKALSAQPNRNAEAGAAESGAAKKYIAFMLADETYALEILAVREIIGLLAITPVPRTEPGVCGVINLRGKVIPVVDLRVRLGLDAAEPNEQSVIIVIQYARGGVDTTEGLLVDEVVEVLDLNASESEPCPDFGGGVDMRFVESIAKVGERITIVLDIEEALGG